jgi:hypothetical protein
MVRAALNDGGCVFVVVGIQLMERAQIRWQL